MSKDVADTRMAEAMVDFCVSEAKRTGMQIGKTQLTMEALRNHFSQPKLIASTCLVKGCSCKEGESYKMKLSVRGSQWMQFSAKVLHHIENYTVPQYGDYPDDPIETWKAEFCALTAEKYMNRRGKAQRPGEELLDIIKAVHVLQITHDKMEVERNG